MQQRHRLLPALLLGLVLASGSVPAAYGHTGGADWQDVVTPMVFSVLLGGLGYLFMVWEIPQALFGKSKGRQQWDSQAGTRKGQKWD